ncbi:addiction module protein [Marinobacter lacisalsi]|uniref:Addiction module protein n=1 Tax=Marinobacter lacisalsi TaxID=475979 RepID=A0ABV8QJJ2_9GAMM
MTTDKTMDNVDRMTSLEKIRAMEQLWDALTRDSELPASPHWHEEELQRRASRIQENQVNYLSLDQLKERGPKT